DRERQRARSAGIRAVPTFQVGNLRVKGYEGPAWLLQQLTQSAGEPESPDRDADPPSSDVTGAPATRRAAGGVMGKQIDGLLDKNLSVGPSKTSKHYLRASSCVLAIRSTS
ncbi:MAG: hypothetical protein ACQKBV_11000, partial [Puniceicoccales bacterium]